MRAQVPSQASNEVVILELFEVAWHLHVQEEHFQSAVDFSQREVYLRCIQTSFWLAASFQFS